MNSTLYQASSFLPVEEIRYIATTQPYLFACGIFFSIAVSYTSMRSFFSIVSINLILKVFNLIDF